jgi:hypothetical protein
MEQHWELGRKLRGHNAYYGITGNQLPLSRFRYESLRVWRKWLMSFPTNMTQAQGGFLTNMTQGS